ncbi:MAG: multidrug efflux SMR transporter [Homoserinimonas sp.]|nr:multidrug efflux SMR transporter [Homoserinimonas sp.]
MTEAQAPERISSTPRSWLYLALAITTEVSGSLSLRGAIDAPWLYSIVAFGFVASFVFLSLVLKEGMGIGVAYGIWGACGVALTAVMSMLLFGESITPLMGIGIVVIIAGVLTIELGSQAAERKAAGHPKTAPSTREGADS